MEWTRHRDRPAVATLARLWASLYGADARVIDRDGAIAVITIDNPPVNALSQAVREGIVTNLEAAEADAEPLFTRTTMGAPDRTSSGPALNSSFESSTRPSV